MYYNERIIKKIVSIILTVVIVLSVSGESLALENNVIKMEKENIDKCVIIAALDWAKFICPELDMEIGDIYQINVAYNLDEIEYAVSYFEGVVPYGYAVVSFYDGQAVIKEVTIERGLEGLYTNLIDVVDEKSDVQSADLKIKGNVVELSPMKYCVVTENAQKDIVSYDNYGNAYEEKEIGYAAYYSTVDGFYIATNNWVSSKYDVDENTEVILECTKGRKIFQEQLSLVNAGRYACAVQALYNISHWWRINGYYAKTMQTEYIKIWEYTNTTEIYVPGTPTNYMYGETIFYNIGKGFVKYLDTKGYENSTYEELNTKPSESWIRTKLRNNNPIVFNYKVDTDVEGHAIAIMGIMDATKVSSGNKWTYLMVADGWNATPTYFNYDYVEFVKCQVVCFNIKK